MLVGNTLVVGTVSDGLVAVNTRSGGIRWTLKIDPLSARAQAWELNTDGERLFAGLGTAVFALPAS